MRDFIENLRAKPEHVRRQVAMGASAGVTGVVAVAWAAALFASGGLTLAPASAETVSGADFDALAEDTRSAFSELLGAAGAAGGASASQQAGIRVVDGETSSTLERDEAPAADQRTVIPF